VSARADTASEPRTLLARARGSADIDGCFVDPVRATDRFERRDALAVAAFLASLTASYAGSALAHQVCGARRANGVRAAHSARTCAPLDSPPARR
jgi:hypothetical protein